MVALATAKLGKAVETGEALAESLRQASREELAAARRGVRTLRRTLEHGYDAAYDAVEETTHLVKRHPWPAVGIVFATAFTLGALAGWSLARKV